MLLSQQWWISWKLNLAKWPCYYRINFNTIDSVRKLLTIKTKRQQKLSYAGPTTEVYLEQIPL